MKWTGCTGQKLGFADMHFWYWSHQPDRLSCDTTIYAAVTFHSAKYIPLFHFTIPFHHSSPVIAFQSTIPENCCSSACWEGPDLKSRSCPMGHGTLMHKCFLVLGTPWNYTARIRLSFFSLSWFLPLKSDTTPLEVHGIQCLPVTLVPEIFIWLNYILIYPHREEWN